MERVSDNIFFSAFLGLLVVTPALLMGLSFALPVETLSTVFSSEIVIVAAILLLLAASFKAGFNPVKAFANAALLTRLGVLVPFSAALWVAANDLGLGSFGAIRTYMLAATILAAAGLTHIVSVGGADTAKRLLFAVIASATLYAAFLFCLMLIGILPEDHFWFEYSIAPGFQNVRFIGLIAAPALITSVFMAGLDEGFDKKRFALWFAVVTMLWTLILWSGTRSAFFVLMAAFPIVFFLMRERKRILAALFFGAFLVSVPLSMLHQPSPPAFGLVNAVLRYWNAEDFNQVSSNRLMIWKQSYATSLEKPITGHGIGQFADVTGLGHLHQAHNAVFSHLVALGYPATLFLMLWLAAMWFAIAGAVWRNTNPVIVPAFACLSVMLAYSMLDGVFYYFHTLLIVSVAAGCGLGLRQTTTANHEEKAQAGQVAGVSV